MSPNHIITHLDRVVSCADVGTDPDSFQGERLVLRSEYYGGSPIMASKVIARRRTSEEEIAPQSQVIYGMFLAPFELLTL